MTMLICSGTLFSEWENIHEQYLLAGSSQYENYAGLSAFNEKICLEHMPGSEKLNWQAFTPDERYSGIAIQLLRSARKETQFAWADTNSSLMLDFWQTACEDAGFVLFYSSPEYELSNYLQSYALDRSAIRKVMDAWTVRTRAMLTFFMQARNRCLLIDVQSAIGNPGDLVRTINATFDTGLSVPGKKGYTPPGGSVLHEYFAATLLTDDDVAAELFDEIRSAATLLDDKDLALRDIQARAELMIPAFLGEINRHAQLITVQTELDNARKQISDLSGEKEQLQAEAAKTTDSLENDLKQTADELAMMALQLHQTQEELEFYYLSERDTTALNEKYVDFLNQNPLLKLARLARLNEASE